LKIVHKKEKTFGPNSLFRRKWYTGDPPTKEFQDGTDDRAGDIVLRKDDPEDANLLELEDFMRRLIVERDSIRKI